MPGIKVQLYIRATGMNEYNYTVVYAGIGLRKYMCNNRFEASMLSTNKDHAEDSTGKISCDDSKNLPNFKKYNYNKTYHSYSLLKFFIFASCFNSRIYSYMHNVYINILHAIHPTFQVIYFSYAINYMWGLPYTARSHTQSIETR